ncbi:MAG TPA: DUF4105 domain-containing protein [Thermoanaerobaculia bacterium]|nr:DUF4105 domain-containing protein [Thermoanaerobaculia bacterium]
MAPPTRRRLLLAAVATALAFSLPFLVVRIVRTPSNDREWHPAQRVLPRVSVSGDRVGIRNVRDFAYRSDADFDQQYVDRTYDLGKLDSVWYGVSRFGAIPGLAHSFLTFGFGDEYVAISVEARKEADETYSPFRGLLRQYELMYVIGTERDVIGLRTDVWQEDVHLYPVRATPEAMRRAFLDMVTRAEKLARSPEFYNTLTSSCSSNIVRHVNAISPGHVRAGLHTILPGYSDRLAYRLGLIDSDLPFERLRGAFRIERSRRFAADDDFSAAIRARLPTPHGRRDSPR